MILSGFGIGGQSRTRSRGVAVPVTCQEFSPPTKADRAAFITAVAAPRLVAPPVNTSLRAEGSGPAASPAALTDVSLYTNSYPRSRSTIQSSTTTPERTDPESSYVASFINYLRLGRTCRIAHTQDYCRHLTRFST